MSNSDKPLKGYTILELAGIGPGPYAGQLLSDLGADVTVVDRAPSGNPAMDMAGIDARGKKSIIVDIKSAEGAEIILKLAAKSDILIEGLRPGVMERLGLGPEACHARNPKLIYGRMTGWGQEGPWSKMAGHDINYISMTGALNAIGPANAPPPPPLNMIGDFGGGSMFLVTGLLAALLKAEKTGQGDIVDASIIDGTASLMSFIHGMAGRGQWQAQRAANLLDGAAPYYRCYETADGKYMAVGCIEKQFFTEMMDRLPIDKDEYGKQNDFSKWSAQHEMLAKVFASKSRDEWEAIFALTDACVTPVLNYQEAATHPVNVKRNAYIQNGSWNHPQMAPRFSGSAIYDEFTLTPKGSDGHKILNELGYDENDITKLADANIVSIKKD